MGHIEDLFRWLWGEYDKKDPVGIIRRVVIVGVALILLLTLLRIATSTPKPDVHAVLSLNFSYTGSSGPDVTVIGTVYNDGDKVAYVVLHYDIRDSRGWSISGNLQIGRIVAGGSVNVNNAFDWPNNYEGEYLISQNGTHILPTWTYELTVT